ncbi:MAG: hypothetical protein WD845_14710 [Pirellulales bacterium]
MRRYRRYIVGLACVVAFGVIGPFRFGFYSVCTDCGALRHTDRRELPFIAIPYWTSHSVETTPLSRACATTHLVGEHNHTWLFGQGNTFPLWSCSLGRGSSISGQAMSEHVAVFIKNVTQFESLDEARKWLGLALDADTSRFVYGALLDGQFPETGFDNAQEYRLWAATGLGKMNKSVVEMIEFEKIH